MACFLLSSIVYAVDMNTTIERTKAVQPDYAILPIFSQRFSPYAFSSQPVNEEDLRACFEAARWAMSSYNEQPWRYLTARAENQEEFDKIVSCLWDANQAWAKKAPVLALGFYKKSFSQNDKPNKAAPHDLGAASAFLTVEATQRGLYVHQMIGVEPDKVREQFDIPEDFEPHTAMAIGYLGSLEDLQALPDGYADRDRSERSRKSQDEILFSGQFGKAAKL